MQPNKRLQQTCAALATLHALHCSASLLRNVRLTTSGTAHAAEAHVREAATLPDENALWS